MRFVSAYSPNNTQTKMWEKKIFHNLLIFLNWLNLEQRFEQIKPVLELKKCPNNQKLDQYVSKRAAETRWIWNLMNLLLFWASKNISYDIQSLCNRKKWLQHFHLSSIPVILVVPVDSRRGKNTLAFMRVFRIKYNLKRKMYPNFKYILLDVLKNHRESQR